MIFLSNKFIEALYLVESLNNYDSFQRNNKYSPNLLLQLKQLRFYHILKNSKKLVVENWIQEFFEEVIKETNYIHVSKKLDDLSKKSKSLFSDKDKEVVLVIFLF